MIDVKIIEIGKKNEDYTLDDGSTVDSLFRASKRHYTQGTVTKNNRVVTKNTPLYDGDRIFIGSMVKGNVDPFLVKFVVIGGPAVELAAEDGYTIQRTLDQLEPADKSRFFRADNSLAYEIRVEGGRPVDQNYILQRPSGSAPVRVVCSQRVKGN